MNDLPKISLYYREGTSDKVYNVSIVKVNDGYSVNFSYGRRGKPLLTGTKTPIAVNLYNAERIYSNLVSSKMAKGYKVDRKSTANINVIYNVGEPVVKQIETEDKNVVMNLPTGRKFNFN